jgi:hypothetical protein
MNRISDFLVQRIKQLRDEKEHTVLIQKRNKCILLWGKHASHSHETL